MSIILFHLAVSFCSLSKYFDFHSFLLRIIVYFDLAMMEDKVSIVWRKSQSLGTGCQCGLIRNKDVRQVNAFVEFFISFFVNNGVFH